MIKLLILLFPLLSFGAEDLDKLIKSSSVKDFEPIKLKRTTLNLDDPFLVQIYGTLREKGIKDKGLMATYDALFNKDYQKVLQGLAFYSSENYINATKVYVLYRLGLAQSAVNMWIDLTKDSHFLNSQLAIALDQVIGKEASEWMVKKGIVLTERQVDHLRSFGNQNIRFQDSLRALAFLRSGEKSLKIIPYLEVNDPLRLELAKSVILAYARKGELSNAAKVLKGVFEPVLSKSDDTEAISDYYLMLARLLYQAKAFDAAWEYYQVIPDESRNFMTAQVESMWISMRQENFARIKGHAKTLELDIFRTEFLPERHLVSAMAHLKTCQFEKVNHSFENFLIENKNHAKVITENMEKDVPKIINEENFVFNRLQTGQKRIPLELGKLGDLEGYRKTRLKDQIALIDKRIVEESKRQWRNRKKILEAAIQRMRFVKVEYLSSMRRLKDKLALMQKNSDKVSIKNSGIKKSERIVFPFDGVFFADELFHVTSAVTNLCLKEKK